VASGATLGILIPPSINLIIYGAITNTSIGNMFTAGIPPGLLLAALFMLTIILWCSLDHSIAGKRVGLAPRLARRARLKHLVPPLFIFMLVMGGIYEGFATPTEAAVAGGGGGEQPDQQPVPRQRGDAAPRAARPRHPDRAGTDQAIADDVANLWAVARMTGLIHSIDQPDYEHWPSALEVLDCLIAGGHAAMGYRAAGTIAPGQAADLCLIDLDTLAFTPLNDLHRQLVHCGDGSSVRLTMVDRRVVCAVGAVTTLDGSPLRAEARAALDEAAAVVEPLRPAYTRMYLRAAARDVGMTRWVGGGSMLTSHGRYPYVPITRKTFGSWPGSARLAVDFGLGVEEYVFGEGLTETACPAPAIPTSPTPRGGLWQPGRRLPQP
jgi:hypothetical protein